MAKSGHPNFVYRISSPWRTQRHTWSITGNHSGSSFSSGDAETFMTGSDCPFVLSFAPFLTTANSGTAGYATDWHQVVGAAYYDGQNSAPVWEAEYSSTSLPPATLFPLGTAPTTGGSNSYGSLEACALLKAPVGKSKTNKPVFVRKFIHGLPSEWISTDADGAQTFELSTAGAAALQSLSNNSWYGSRVYIAPSGNQPAATDWVVGPGAHQMPRGRRKVSAAKGSSALSTLENLFLHVGEGAAGNLLSDLIP